MGFECIVGIGEAIMDFLRGPLLPERFEERCWYIFWVGVGSAGSAEKEDEGDEEEDADDSGYCNLFIVSWF
jgi:hypothetical protein